MDINQKCELEQYTLDLYKYAFFYEFPDTFMTFNDIKVPDLEIRAMCALKIGEASGKINTCIKHYEVSDENYRKICDNCFYSRENDVLYSNLDYEIGKMINTKLDDDEVLRPHLLKFWNDIYNVKIAEVGFNFGNKLLDDIVRNFISHTIFVPKPERK